MSRTEESGFEELERALEEVASEERRDLAQAARLELPAGRAEAAFLAAASPAPRKTNPVLPFLLAAAGVLLLAFGLRGLFVGEEAPSGGGVLGPHDIEAAPSGEVEGFGVFRWNAALPAGGHFLVRVRGAGLERASEWLTASSWDPGDTSAWPDEIEWVLEVYGGSDAGDLRARHVTWASR